MCPDKLGLVVAVSSDCVLLASINHVGRYSFSSICIHLHSEDDAYCRSTKGNDKLPVNQDSVVHSTTSFPSQAQNLYMVDYVALGLSLKEYCIITHHYMSVNKHFKTFQKYFFMCTLCTLCTFL